MTGGAVAIGGALGLRYSDAMNGLFPTLMILAMLMVVGSLFVGLFFMVRGNGGDARRSNKAMRLRVALQGVALLLFVVAMLVQG
ncbi:Uncharacterized protein RL4316 [Azospirillum doebereinerae]